jgi:hypothetical protein
MVSVPDVLCLTGVFMYLDERLKCTLVKDGASVQISLRSDLTGEIVGSGALIHPEGKRRGFSKGSRITQRHSLTHALAKVRILRIESLTMMIFSMR